MLRITLLCTFFTLRALFVLLCILVESITEEIYLIHKAYKLNSSFHHVKGNQDSPINNDQLYLPTQLNIQSEKLAGKFHSFEDFEFHHPVNMIPACPATLPIQGMDVTRNY